MLHGNLPAVYFYSARVRRSRGASWSSFSPALTNRIDHILVFAKKLVINTTNTVWLANLDNKSAHRIEGIDARVAITQTAASADKLFINSQDTLWIVRDESQLPPTADKFLTANIHGIAALGERLFIGTDEGLRIVARDSTHIEQVDGISGQALTGSTVGDELFGFAAGCLWIISKDGTRANRVNSIESTSEQIVNFHDQVYLFFIPPRQGNNIFSVPYRIDRRVTIDTQLHPSGWWAATIALLLPSRWLPAERVQATACYSNLVGTCDDPYAENISKEFRFARATGADLPSDDKFSPIEQFTYEIGWGRNEAHYWVKDKWGNAFEHKAVYHGVPSQYVMVALPLVLS